MKIIKAILTIIFILSTYVSFCEETQWYFVTSYNNQLIELKIYFLDNEMKNGFVQYKNHDKEIKIILKNSEELKRTNGRPSLFQYEWEEEYDGQATGKYIMVFQGARIYHFIYLRYKDNRIFCFDELFYNGDGW